MNNTVSIVYMRMERTTVAGKHDCMLGAWVVPGLRESRGRNGKNYRSIYRKFPSRTKGRMGQERLQELRS